MATDSTTAPKPYDKVTRLSRTIPGLPTEERLADMSITDLLKLPAPAGVGPALWTRALGILYQARMEMLGGAPATVPPREAVMQQAETDDRQAKLEEAQAAEKAALDDAPPSRDRTAAPFAGAGSEELQARMRSPEHLASRERARAIVNDPEQPGNLFPRPAPSYASAEEGVAQYSPADRLAAVRTAIDFEDWRPALGVNQAKAAHAFLDELLAKASAYDNKETDAEVIERLASTETHLPRKEGMLLLAKELRGEAPPTAEVALEHLRRAGVMPLLALLGVTRPEQTEVPEKYDLSGDDGQDHEPYLPAGEFCKQVALQREQTIEYIVHAYVCANDKCEDAPKHKATIDLELRDLRYEPLAHAVRVHTYRDQRGATLRTQLLTTPQRKELRRVIAFLARLRLSQPKKGGDS